MGFTIEKKHWLNVYAAVPSTNYIQPHASTTIFGSVFRVAVELFSM